MSKFSNDSRDALKDMLYSLKGIFKQYTRPTRRSAWHDLTDTKSGKQQVEKLLTNPDQPIVGIPRLRFKEWLNTTSAP